MRGHELAEKGEVENSFIYLRGWLVALLGAWSYLLLLLIELWTALSIDLIDE